MDGHNPLRTPKRVGGAMAAALAMTGLGAGEAAAQSAPSPVMLLTQPASAARQYATPDGAVRFVFDRSGGRVALLRFDGDPEVHVLRPTGGPGGDEIYRTESGDVLLRLTPHGGLTVYTRSQTAGMPASEERTVAPLAPRAWATVAYQARMRALQQIATQRLGRPVLFVAPREPAEGDSGVLIDAAERVAEGIVRVRNTPIQRVVITIGSTPATQVRGDALLVQVTPRLGYAGRPSSRSIHNVVLRATQGPEQ